jgi:hypothetical protein
MSCRAESCIAFQDRCLGEAGKAFPNASGASLADTLDGLQIIHSGPEEALEATEVLHQPLQDSGRQPGHFRKQS